MVVWTNIFATSPDPNMVADALNKPVPITGVV